MKSFLTACGVEESLQLVVESQSGHEGELRLLHQPFAVIGRDSRADVVLDHPEVSRRHVYVQVIEERAFWVDLESRTGSRGESELQRFGWLEGGRILCVGPYVIRRFIGAGQANGGSTRRELPRDVPLVALAYSRTPLPEVTLEFLNGPAQSMSRPVHRVLSLVGSASGCKFRLTDPSVSRFHASLLRTSAGLWIVDLLGQGGISVNEVPVRSNCLADGDVLKIGRYQIRIRCRLRGQGSSKAKPEIGRAALVPTQPRRQLASSNLQIPDWAPAAIPFGPGAGGTNGPRFPVPLKVVSSATKAELIPSDPTLLDKLPQSETTESVLVPLVNQFGLMQQQMFDQFQQAMSMMVQMFGEMHRDQMDVIRAELDRLHELTDEFHALKNELANRSREGVDIESSDLAGNALGLARTAARESDGLAPVLEARAPAPATIDSSSRLGTVQVPLASAVPPSPATVTSPDFGPSPGPRLPPTPPIASPLAANSSYEQRDEQGPRSQAKTEGGSRLPDSERDTIVWLHQRILALQRERETRWQRILKLLPGIS
jgi:pSer/pThr/pTyr-binding forkhead associated (FHA) protein